MLVPPGPFHVLKGAELDGAELEEGAVLVPDEERPEAGGGLEVFPLHLAPVGRAPELHRIIRMFG